MPEDLWLHRPQLEDGVAQFDVISAMGIMVEMKQVDWQLNKGISVVEHNNKSVTARRKHVIADRLFEFSLNL
jgi:hypothetical protein